MASEKRSMKKALLLAVSLLLIEILIGIALACTTPVDDLTIFADTELCAGTYQINDSGLPGIIQFGGRYDLNCSGTIIEGNGTGYGFVETTAGITMLNCTFKNYSKAGLVGSLWNRSVTWSSSTDGILDIDNDGQGNSVAVGLWANSSQFDWAIAKYDLIGNQVWNRSLSWSTSGDSANAVAIDNSGNIFVAGPWRNSTHDDWGIAKYDASGTLLWNRSISWSTSNDFAEGIDTDPSGNAYVAGYWRNGTNDNWAVAKYDTSGNLLWNRTFAFGPGFSTAVDVAVDSSGNAFVGGTWQNVSFWDWGLLKYDTSGNLLWNRSISWSVDNDEVESVAVDSSGNVFLVGDWYNSTNYDWAVAKYDNSGTLLWNKTIALSTSNEYASSVAVDSAGNAYVAGYWNNGGQNDWYVIKYSPQGSILWNRSISWGASSDIAYAITAEDSGNIIVGGTWFNSGQIDWGIMKLSPEGDVLTNGSDYKNNTFTGSSVGIQLTERTVGNRFYYNNFSNNLQYQVYANDSGNYFNTTDGVAKGNWWSDLFLNMLEIYDNTGDHFADYGTDYPYSAASGGNVSANVIDYAPFAYTCYDNDGDGAFNTSSDPECPGPRDCDDSSSLVLPPRDGLVRYADTVFCPGTYYLNATGDYLMVFSAPGIYVKGNSTTIIGNSSGTAVYLGNNSQYAANMTIINYNVAVASESNNSVYGINISNCSGGLNMDDDSNITFSRIIINDTNIGIFTKDTCTGLNFSDIQISGGSYGLLMSVQSSNILFRDISIFNVSLIGAYVLGSSSEFINTSIDCNSQGSMGYLLYGAQNNTLRNSTIQGCQYGIMLNSSSGNKVYHNNFTGQTIYQVLSNTSGNHFNTTVLGKTQGNWWSDVFINLLELYDTDGDGYADSGPDYPYSNAKGGNVSINVVDYGPVALYNCYDIDGDGSYNTSSDSICPGYRDCDDNNATLLPPRDDLAIINDTYLCPGTYYVNDSGIPGVIQYGGDWNLSCQGTRMIGNGTGVGVFDTVSQTDLYNCSTENYGTAAYLGGLWEQSIRWSTGSDSGRDVALDSSGNSYYVGTYYNVSHSDWRVAKYDPYGNLLWNRTLYWGTGTDSAEAVAVDDNGNLFVAGYWRNSTHDDWGVAKYDTSGNLLWNKSISWSSSNDAAYGIAVDYQGNAYVTGYWNNGGQSDWGLVKLDGSGNTLWTKSLAMSGANADLAYAVDVDELGNTYVAGTLYNTTLAALDWAVAKFDPDGNLVWNVSPSLPLPAGIAYAIDVDDEGNSYVGGYLAGVGTSDDWAIAKLDGSGTAVWSNTLVWSTGADRIEGLSADVFGNTYTVGYWRNSTHDDWGVIKYDPQGNQIWNRSFSWSTSNDYAWGVAADTSGAPYIIGFWNNGGDDDWKVLKLSPEGDLIINGSTFRNNTFKDSDYGVYLSNITSASLFYYNTFNSNNLYQAYADISGNHFNTTNGSACGAQCARGNWWTDIFTNNLEILDANSDTWGDSGADYPYSAANGGNVSANIVDYGPQPVALCLDSDGDGSYASGYGTDEDCRAYRDCDDANASLFSPYDGVLVKYDSWLCPGTYHINNSEGQGVVKIVSDAKLMCNGAVIIGNNTGTGIFSSYSDSNITDCQIYNYSKGLWAGNHWNITLDADPAAYDLRDVYVQDNDDILVAGSENSTGNFRYLLIKYSYDGTELWNWTYDTSTADYLDGVVADSQRNVWAVGYNTTHGLVIKFDSDGNELWNASAAGVYFQAIAVDSQDQVVAVGSVAANSRIVQYDNAGTELWSGTVSIDYFSDVAVDSSDNIIVVGKDDLPVTADNVAWVLKFNNTGSQLWNYSVNNENSNFFGDYFYGVAIDSRDAVVAVGSLTVSGVDNRFVLKLDSDGSQLWNWSDYDSPNENFVSVAVDYDDNVYAYATRGNAYDHMIDKINGNTGALMQETIFSTTPLPLPKSIDIDSNGMLVLANSQFPQPLNGEIIRLTLNSTLSASGIQMHNNTVGNSTIGVFVNQYTNGLARNNTFKNSSYGAYIGAGLSGMQLYYNNFSTNSIYQAYADYPGTEFNTTVGAYAQGNYWSDIDYTFQIFDTNYDGFGDFGIDLPYNSTNGGAVQGYVNDHGPIITQNPPCFEPFDGMVLQWNATLCSGTYYVNSTGNLIDLDADHLTLTCNATVLIGDGTNNGIYSDNDNIAVLGCTVKNYSAGFINFENLHQINTTIRNSSFTDNTLVGFGFIPFSASYSGAMFTIVNSTFSRNYYGIAATALNDSLIWNNSLLNNTLGMLLDGNTLNSKDNNLTENVFQGNTYDLNFTALTTGNNVWLNHFYSYGVSDLAGTNNDYCMGSDGNFYEYQIPASRIGHDDCGQVNISIPTPGGQYGTIIPITLSAQSTKYLTPVLYYLEYSNNSGSNWYDITTTTALTYPWDVSNQVQYPNLDTYQVRVIPNDGFANGTYNWTEDFEINHTLPITYDNVTTDDRFWYVDTPAYVRLWTETPNWNTTYWCDYSIYGAACTSFTGVESNDTAVEIDGVPNGVAQKYVRYWHNDSNGLEEYPHDSAQINIVYGSFINDTFIWNSTVQNNSYITGSDINDSVIDHCYVVNSTIIDSNLTGLTNCRVIDSTIINSNLTDSTFENVTCDGCTATGSTVINTSVCDAFGFVYATVVDRILTAGRLDYYGTSYYEELSMDRICEGLPRMNLTYPVAGSIVNGTVVVLFTSPENNTPMISIDGGTWTATDDNTTYAWDTTALVEGAHTVQIRDVDQAGRYIYSNIVTVTVENVRQSIIIIRPESDGLLLNKTEVLAVAPEYTSKVYFSLTNASGSYDLTGAAGETEDSDGSDGWSAYIDITGLAEGSYNLTAKSYTRCYFVTDCYNSSYTVTNLTIDRTAPVATMNIVGSAGGTGSTSYPNVILNMTFGEGDHCRFANEVEGDLATAAWEPCQANKAWSLINEYGTRTVYAQVKDAAGNTVNLSDTIAFSFTPDATPPTAPVVYDGLGEDADWVSSNTTLSANWFNATEDISVIYYRYRILSNGTAIGGYVDVGMQTSMTNDTLTLVDGTNYSIEVQAYSAGGDASGYSDGAWTDFSRPGNVNVTSPTHPVQATAYANSTAIFEFNATDNGPSGIEGYSYILDKYPGTGPDDLIEIREYSELLAYTSGGQKQTLYDNITQDSYKTVTRIDHTLKENQTIKVRFAVYEEGGEQAENVKFEIGLTDEACANFASCSFMGRNDTIIDVKYSYTAGGAVIYEAVVTATADVADSDFYVIVGINDTHAGSRNISIPYSSTTGLETQTCIEGGSCTTNNTRRYAIGISYVDTWNETNTATYYDLADGTYYFHVRAKDYAGNFGNTTHYQIVIAGGGSMALEAPMNGQLFLSVSDTLNVTATLFVSTTTDAKIVVVHADGSTTNTSVQTVVTSANFNATLRQGTNELYAESSGGARSSSVFVILAKEPSGASNKTIAVRHSSCTTTDSNLCYFTSGDVTVGIAGEEGTASSGVVVGKTEHNTMKIFATSAAGFIPGTVNSLIVDDSFLDEINPMFGFDRKTGKYVIRDALQYQDIYISGDERLAPGKYNLYIIHNGVTSDGKVNLTIAIGR